MISAIVVAPDLVGGEDTVRLAEVVARSLAWLVSAVVTGTVREVTLAAPAGLGLGELADQAGCALVQDEPERARLAAAIATSRGPLLLVFRAGYLPQTGLIEEIQDLVAADPAATGAILAAPSRLRERFLPDLAPTVGVLAPLEVCVARADRGFAGLARAARRPLRHRAAALVV